MHHKPFLYSSMMLAMIAALPVEARTPDATAFMDWAETTFSSYFPGHQSNQSIQSFTARHYPATGNYLGADDTTAYVYGPVTGNQLLPVGTLKNLSCRVYASECAAEVTTLLNAEAALYATALPDSARTYENYDACYKRNGWTTAAIIAETSSVGQTNHKIGQSLANNLQVLAERHTTNADGSARRELDVSFDIRYSDGTTASNHKTTLIQGSSHGSCASPEDRNSWRFLGNSQMVDASVEARNVRTDAYKLADGSLRATSYSRTVQFRLKDPSGVASYAVLTGPNGFSLKLISPRLLRSESALAGKRGNFLNYQDSDYFATCRTASNSTPHADEADCSGQGASGNTYSVTYTPGGTTTAASADTTFNNLAFNAGAEFTFAIYNDDGWQTVNGQQGKIPVATYTLSLNKAPYTFAELEAADAYAAISSSSLSMADLATALRTGAAASSTLALKAPVQPADGRRFALLEIGEYFSGPAAGNASGASYPAYRYYNATYPGGTALSVSAFPITISPAEISSKTYGDISLYYGDRSGGQFVHTLSFY